jgi:hypothetical protein
MVASVVNEIRLQRIFRGGISSPQPECGTSNIGGTKLVERKLKRAAFGKK